MVIRYYEVLSVMTPSPRSRPILHHSSGGGHRGEVQSKVWTSPTYSVDQLLSPLIYRRSDVSTGQQRQGPLGVTRVVKRGHRRRSDLMSVGLGFSPVPHLSVPTVSSGGRDPGLHLFP